jgi:hypothetical protein
MLGSPSSAVATDRRCRIPRENVLTRRRATASVPRSAETVSTRSSSCPPRAAWTRRCCRAVSEGCRPPPSMTAPTRAVGSGKSTYRLPPMTAVPSSGRMSPSNMRSVVLFPAPFGPNRPVTRPWVTVSEIPSTADTEPKRFVSRSASTATPFTPWLLRPGEPPPRARRARSPTPRRTPQRRRERTTVSASACLGASQADDGSHRGPPRCQP